MLPRIGRSAGAPAASPAGSRGRASATTPSGKYSRPQSRSVEVTDSESDLDESTDEELLQAQRSRSAALVRGASAERDGGMPRALSRGTPQSAQKRHDRTLVPQGSAQRPVSTQPRVYDMSRNTAAEVSDSTGDESEGDAEGRRFLQHAALQRETSRQESRPGTEYEAGTVRSKYGVKVKVGGVKMDNYNDFDTMVRTATRDGRRAMKDEERAIRERSAAATEAQRLAMEEAAERELDRADDMAAKRERWELRQRERQLRAAQIAARGVPEVTKQIALLWLGTVRRAGPGGGSPRREAPGPGGEAAHRPAPGFSDGMESSHREDTARLRLLGSNEEEIESYRQEARALPPARALRPAGQGAR